MLREKSNIDETIWVNLSNYQVIEDAFTKKSSDHYPHLINLK